MYLSRPAEYALRAMTYLARQDPGERILTRDLAEAINVPAPFLSKIMRRRTGRCTPNGACSKDKSSNGQGRTRWAIR